MEALNRRRTEPLSHEILLKLALLARLPNVEGDEARSKLIGEMNAVLQLFESLQSLDLQGFEPLQGAPGVDARASQREDRSVPFDAESVLSCAPELEGRGFVVPSVMGS